MLLLPNTAVGLLRAGRAARVQGAPSGVPLCQDKGWAGSGTIGVRLSQLGQPLGSLPVPEDKASPAASVTLLLFCSSSHACVGRDPSLWMEVSLAVPGVSVSAARPCCAQQPGGEAVWGPLLVAARRPSRKWRGKSG